MDLFATGQRCGERAGKFHSSTGRASRNSSHAHLQLSRIDRSLRTSARARRVLRRVGGSAYVVPTMPMARMRACSTEDRRFHEETSEGDMEKSALITTGPRHTKQPGRMQIVVQNTGTMGSGSGTTPPRPDSPREREGAKARPSCALSAVPGGLNGQGGGRETCHRPSHSPTVPPAAGRIA